MIGKEPKVPVKTTETVGDGWERLSRRSPYTPPPTMMEDIIGFESLAKSSQKCAANTSWKDSVAHFKLNWIRECRKLERELNNGTYRERKRRCFTVTSPKRREIVSMAYRDRVYQRSLNDVALYPIVSKSLIYDNHACQNGKGTLKAKERFRCMLQRHYRKHKLTGYVLRCDIKGYYPNMSHQKARDWLVITLRRNSPPFY